MTPDQCKTAIKSEYNTLMAMVGRGTLNETAVFGLIEPSCRNAARHNGVPNLWRMYLPPGVQG